MHRRLGRASLATRDDTDRSDGDGHPDRAAGAHRAADDPNALTNLDSHAHPDCDRDALADRDACADLDSHAHADTQRAANNVFGMGHSATTPTTPPAR